MGGGIKQRKYESGSLKTIIISLDVLETLLINSI